MINVNKNVIDKLGKCLPVCARMDLQMFSHHAQGLGYQELCLMQLCLYFVPPKS